MNENIDASETRAKLLGSLLLFTQTFYKIRTGRDFELSEPLGRESHYITICRELTNVFRGKETRLLINIPPGHGKSELLIHFICWCMAHYPDCAFLYISYSKDLAAEHTATIKRIMDLPQYKLIFDVHISRDSSAKDDFKTTNGGSISAFGSSGGITGRNAGIPNLDRFSGAVIMDDMHKPDEVHSDTMREAVIKNYNQTIKQRPRGINVPLIFIGQRLHEDDLPAFFIDKRDGYEWRKVILRSLDEAGNALCPKIKTKEMLLIERDINEYVFYSQHQQTPQPAGGGIFKEKDIVLLDIEPEFLATFITVDSAETKENYNDATAFGHWGIYKIKEGEVELDLLGLHLIDCWEIRVEPKDLEYEFNQFYASSLMHKVKPQIAAIEKKSTGVTLVSVLKNKRGLQIVDIERTRASGNKTTRYLEIQPYAASKRISVLSTGKLWSVKDNKPVNIFINHIGKITANNTHKNDDICDTFYDAVKIGLISEFITKSLNLSPSNDISKNIVSSFMKSQQLRAKAYASR